MKKKKKELRYTLIDNRTGKSVAESDSLEELRLEISQALAAVFTLHDRRWSTFGSAEYLFKHESEEG